MNLDKRDIVKVHSRVLSHAHISSDLGPTARLLILESMANYMVRQLLKAVCITLTRLTGFACLATAAL